MKKLLVLLFIVIASFGCRSKTYQELNTELGWATVPIPHENYRHRDWYEWSEWNEDLGVGKYSTTEYPPNSGLYYVIVPIAEKEKVQSQIEW